METTSPFSPEAIREANKWVMCEDLDPVVELLRDCEAVKPEAENIPTNKESPGKGVRKYPPFVFVAKGATLTRLVRSEIV